MRYDGILGRAIGALIIALPMTAIAGNGARTAWSEVSARPLDAGAVQPARFRSLDLDVGALRRHIDQEVVRGESLSLPTPEGGFRDFVLEQSGTMDPQLAARYPQITSLRGRDDEGNAVRVDVSPLGVQAMVFDRDGGVWLVQPETPNDDRRYLSFRRAELTPSGQFQCGVHGEPDAAGANLMNAGPQPMTTTGTNLRTMRTVVAATGEYTQHFGGTVANGMAAIVVAMNRVNQVYENEFSVHMTLVANNDLTVFTDPVTDGLTNDDGGLLIDEIQTKIDTIIGSANYDVGHVFSTGGGGIAGLGVICATGSKAEGVTGLTNPVGDPFYIDYVAHEMGHQYGGRHTFNSVTGACSGNRSSSAAYETGSGSTIMAYAGICGANNLQPNSDPYFHAFSLQEINNRLNATSCGTIVPNTNIAPVIAPLLNAYIIPIRTPFSLTGSATDANGDPITYDWEEFDLGAQTNIGIDNGTSPVARSYNPTTSGTRIVPRVSNLLANTFAPGEILPQLSRPAFKWRLTVRDNHPGGGMTVSADIPAIQVTSTSGPFVMTAPNTAVTWSAGNFADVNWNVANTTTAPVSCNLVDIRLSIDGGLTFPTTLVTGVPNNGAATVVVPVGSNTTQARVKVSCATNIFFDVSDANFTIATPVDALFADDFDGP